MKLANLFDMYMLWGNSTVKFTKITLDKTKELLDDNVESYINDKSLANVLLNQFDIPVVENPWCFIAEKNEKFIIADYRGPTLSENATSLPEKGKITFWLVEIE